MSKIEELIQQLCSNGVEWKTVGELCNLSRGKVYSKQYLSQNEGEFPVYVLSVTICKTIFDPQRG